MIHPDSRPLFLPAAIVARGTCRCFGRRGPCLRPSSSSTRSTPWPAREEGKAQKKTLGKTSRKALNVRRTRPLISHGVREGSPPPSSLSARGGKTQDAVFSRGVSVGWHWEHLWLKGKRTGREMGGGGWGGQRTQTGGAQTLHCGRRQQMGRAGGPSVQRAVSFLAEAEVGGRSPEADRPTTRRRRRTEHLRACDAAVKSQSSKTEILRPYS